MKTEVSFLGGPNDGDRQCLDIPLHEVLGVRIAQEFTWAEWLSNGLRKRPDVIHVYKLDTRKADLVYVFKRSQLASVANELLQPGERIAD